MTCRFRQHIINYLNTLLTDQEDHDNLDDILQSWMLAQVEVPGFWIEECAAPTADQLMRSPHGLDFHILSNRQLKRLLDHYETHYHREEWIAFLQSNSERPTPPESPRPMPRP